MLVTTAMIAVIVGSSASKIAWLGSVKWPRKNNDNNNNNNNKTTLTRLATAKPQIFARNAISRFFAMGSLGWDRNEFIFSENKLLFANLKYNTVQNNLQIIRKSTAVSYLTSSAVLLRANTQISNPPRTCEKTSIHCYIFNSTGDKIFDEDAGLLCRCRLCKGRSRYTFVSSGQILWVRKLLVVDIQRIVSPSFMLFFTAPLKTIVSYTVE